MALVVRLRRTAFELALSLLAGVLLALPCWSDLFLLTPYVGLLPWVYLFGIRERRGSWLTFLAGGALFWISYHSFLFGYAWFVPFVGAAIYTPFYLAFPILLRAARRLNVPWTLATPIAWVATEWIEAHVALARVATVLLGYSQARVLSLIQVADLGGVYAVSFLIALVNGALADLVETRAWTPRALWAARRARAGIATAVLVVTVANLYGLWRLSTLETEPGPRVGIVQPAVEHTGLNNFSAYAPAVYMTAQAWEKPGEVDLIVWPENAIQDHPMERFGVYREDLAWLSARSGAPLLVGAFGRHRRNPSAATNTVFLMGPDGEPVARYDKIRLLPWVEYIPFEGVLAAIDPDLAKHHARYAARIVGYATAGRGDFRGEEVTVFRFPGLPPFSALICFETADPELARQAARGGARFLVNPTSEGRVGAALQLQMLRISAFRAVETRLPLVRAGNSGISAFVAADGRLQSLLRGTWTGAYTFEPGVMADRAWPARGEKTVYVRMGDAFAVANLLIALLGSAWAFALRRS